MNSNTGVPIPGTSRLKERPQCSDVVIPETVDPLPDFGIKPIPENSGNGRGGGRGKKKNKKLRGMSSLFTNNQSEVSPVISCCCVRRTVIDRNTLCKPIVDTVTCDEVLIERDKTLDSFCPD